MVPLRASDRKPQGRLEVTRKGFGVEDTEDPRLTEREILVAYEGVPAASEVIGTETHLLAAREQC